MMLQPSYTKQFRKDIKRLQKSGSKDIEKVKAVIKLLIEGKQLDPSYKDHQLIGNFKNRRECHIRPDLLLVYKVDKKEMTIVFERAGSHSDVFE